ncbi:glycosyl hydrolase 108 family protein [Mesorhizobium captivum]|uniref:glycosyl hydrolase 108 family protein n=1 Tax=Mesorhizobium captivum TaxID=3072319 RepID=UPI002A23F2AC|nr:glycosyl hydrolase 108 family protein [Mesorhizobium sp. VK3C]MDX8449109.1 glycosyl hydrolase 108 family protein [Mesorhizobium sp. VK3C]
MRKSAIAFAVSKRGCGRSSMMQTYRRFYWDAVLGAELPDGIDYAVFDFAVNSGPGKAAKYLRAVLGVAEDSRVGPATLAAARAKPAGVVIDTLCDARLAFLQRLPTWPTFGKGWGARVASVRAEALLISARPETPLRPTPPPPDTAQPTAGASTGDGAPPASASPGKAAGVLALIALALGSTAAWIAHLPCNLFGVFCQ